MQSESQPASAPPGGGGLPPVTPPSGKFILELFLVPGLIVTLIVCLLLFVNWFFSGPSSPEAFLKKLDDPNPEQRWRGASDLAQVLPRDEHLARNADFALELCKRLNERTESDEKQKDTPEQLFLKRQAEILRTDKSEEQKAEAIDAERRKLDPDRLYVLYLTESLGQFVVPVGAPVLSKMAREEPAEPPHEEPLALAGRRRNAVYALAKLGEKLKQFDKLHSREKELLIDQLKKLVESRSGEPKKWAQSALGCLEQRLEGKYTTMGVDEALVQAARADDPIVRESAAFAMGFWRGNADENRLMDAALVRLDSDEGRGMNEIEMYSGRDPSPTVEVLSQPGKIIQINATLALLRRGSNKVRASRVLEMLDEKELEQAIQLEYKTGKGDANPNESGAHKKEPNRAKVVGIITETLKALAGYYREKPKDDLEGGGDLKGVPARIEELTRNNNPAVATAAREAKKALDAGK
jgi:hypothetical protein